MKDQNKAIVELSMPLGVRTFAEYQTIALGQAASMLNCKPTDIGLEYPQQVRISQALKVTARPAGTAVASVLKRAKRWRGLLIGATALVGIALIVGVRQWQVVSEQRQWLESETAKVAEKIAQLKKSTESPQEKTVAANPLAKAKDIVRQDMNPIFKAIEGIKVPNARLKQLTLEASSHMVQVTYELSQATQVTQITEALNAGAPDFDWTLKSMTDRQAQWVGSF